jgi:nucleoside-diphosphate-sugar epimerase
MGSMKLGFKRALVTGGAGFIGSHLVETLVSGGSKVAVLDNLFSGSYSNVERLERRLSFFQDDIRNPKALERAAENCDVIFHLAAVVSVPQTIDDPVNSAEVNDLGTLLVLETARKKDVKRVVFSSSCAVYGDDPQLPKHEDMRPNPLSPYAAQKLAAEYYARVYYDLYGLETVVLRYFNVFGPRQDPSSPYSGVISIFMTQAVNNESVIIYGDGNQSRDFIFVQDVVKANLLAATADDASGEVINVGTGNSVSIRQLWEMICTLSGSKVDPEYAPKRTGDIYQSLASIESARSLLGFECEYSFNHGLKMTFDWYRQNLMADER